MTRQTFNILLEEYGIWWNDIVEIIIINPKAKPFWMFWKRYPKTIKFKGAINYFFNDNCVKLTDSELNHYAFDFSEIVGINLIRH